MAANIHTFFERAIADLERYEAQETDGRRCDAAREKIAFYREQLRDPAIDDETEWTGRLAGLVQDLESIAAHGSPGAADAVESLRGLIRDLHNVIQGP